jgi:hypothetical protein
MGFPTIAATATSTNDTATTTQTVSLPTGISSGHLLIAGLTVRNATAFTWPAGWNGLYQANASGNNHRIELAYRFADGTEGSSISVTTGNAKGAHFCYRITGMHASQAPEAGTAVNATTTTPNPPSVSPSWGAEDNLFIAVCSNDNDNQVNAYPTNYSLGQLSVKTTATSTVAIGVAGRQLNASSDDPGTFTISGSERTTANTIVVRAGVSVFNESVSESASASDAPSALGVLVAALTESGTATESVAAGLVYAVAIEEAASALDTLSNALEILVAITEAATAEDLIAQGAVYASAVEEAATALDTLASTAELVAAITEALTAEDAITGVLRAWEAAEGSNSPWTDASPSNAASWAESTPSGSDWTNNSPSAAASWTRSVAENVVWRQIR